MSPRMIRWVSWSAAVVVVLGTAIGFWRYTQNRRSNQQVNAATKNDHENSTPNESETPAEPGEPTSVNVICPSSRKMDRVTVQVGSVQAFESVKLDAMVTGYLKSLGTDSDRRPVDIGSPVKKGQVVAVIDVPELEKQAERNAATVELAKARVAQMKAKVAIARADLEAAKAQIAYADANAKSSSFMFAFRTLQHKKMKGLYDTNSIEEILLDEATQRKEAARESESAAKAGVVTARAQALSSDAKIQLAEADVGEAEAQVKVAQADLAKTQVQLSYARITAPFDGVVTQRGYDAKALIRADASGTPPILTIQRTDLLRVVVQIPERDVPHADIGDYADIELDAFPGQKMPAEISLIAKSEDPNTRLMRVEINLKNPGGNIRHGMFGRATIYLEKGIKSLSVPTGCLVGRPDGSKGNVYVARDGKAHKVPIRLGINNGLRVEVLTGLSKGDEVILNPPAALSEGGEVVASRLEENN